MHIAVCEDKQIDATHLVDMLRFWLNEQQISAEISLFVSGEELLRVWVPGMYQIIFMDIYLEGADGIKISKLIRERDADCAIILTTISIDHGLDGFAVGAIHYLIKPVRPQGLDEAMRRCHHLLEANARYIDVVENRVPTRIYLHDIRYIEVYGNSNQIFTTEREIKIYTTLDKLLEQLETPPFLRCHRSYVVNLRHVEHPTAKEFPLKGGGSVPIGRSYRNTARAVYDDYLGSLVQHRHGFFPPSM